jgi:hypothetical protein
MTSSIERPDRIGKRINWRFSRRTAQLLLAMFQPFDIRVKMFIKEVWLRIGFLKIAINRRIP